MVTASWVSKTSVTSKVSSPLTVRGVSRSSSATWKRTIRPPAESVRVETEEKSSL